MKTILAKYEVSILSEFFATLELYSLLIPILRFIGNRRTTGMSMEDSWRIL